MMQGTKKSHFGKTYLLTELFFYNNNFIELCRILHVCHDVLYKQLCSWLLHGSLFDPYKEFFIQHSTGQTTGVATETQEEEDYLGIMGVTGRQLQVRN